MDETMKNSVTEEINEQVATPEEVVSEQETTEDPLRDAIEAQMKKIQRQSMLIGAQTMCHVVLEKIATHMNKPGKRTMNDYKRLTKDIQKFCETGISRKVNEDGETEPVVEESTVENTIQN